jgi:hypothetical protein
MTLSVTTISFGLASRETVAPMLRVGGLRIPTLFRAPAIVGGMRIDEVRQQFHLL